MWNCVAPGQPAFTITITHHQARQCHAETYTHLQKFQGQQQQQQQEEDEVKMRISGAYTVTLAAPSWLAAQTRLVTTAPISYCNLFDSSRARGYMCA
jgi:hypothetical protein